MADHLPFGDVELMLTEHLAADDRLVVTVLPPDLKAQLVTKKAVRVTRSGGLANETGTVDNPRVALLILAERDPAAPRAAFDLARQIEAELLNLPAHTAAGRLDSARVESGPTAFPWTDPDIAAVQLICRLSTRR